jgi:UDP-N-acetylglucosamine--N-acetylmuramyl-(pentapeptide) pyrophosphoryl-undecaprenol N-acetylglucosamine transferase
MKFVIAAGGTGGHLFPGLAVGEVLRQRGYEVMLLISEKEIDSLATQGRTEFRIERLPGIGLPKLLSPAFFGFLKRFKSGLDRCRALFAEFQPDAVLGMGGFTSTAPILAARMRKVPAFLHESNAIPGKANKLNAKLAREVLLGFRECAIHFGGKKCEVTGTPIRRELAQRLPKADALAAFSLTPEWRTLLVMGGSQGARGINRSLAAAAPRLKDHELQVIHLSGAEDVETLRETYAAADIPAYVAAFHHQMEQAYSAADFAIARSGAASLTELSHFSLPSVLIPYPQAAEDHQTLNARIFEKAGAALLLPESGLSGEILAGKLLWCLDDPSRLSEMSACSARLAPREAAERVVETMLKHAYRRPGAAAPR